MTVPTTTPSGWYPDPDGSGQMRWWDGTTWSQHRHEPPKPMTGKYTAPPMERRARWIVGGALLTIAAVSIVIGLINAPATDAHSPTFYAQAACEQAATYELKAPSTAHFAGAAVVTMDSTDSNLYDVRTTVDAQNSFGAQIRSFVRCTVQRLPETKQWKVLGATVS